MWVVPARGMRAIGFTYHLAAAQCRAGDLRGFFCRRLTQGASELRHDFHSPLITPTKKKLISPYVNIPKMTKGCCVFFFTHPHNSTKGGKNKVSLNPPVPHHDTDLHLWVRSLQLPAYGPHDMQFLASDSLSTNVKRLFQTEQANNPNFAISGSEGWGRQPDPAEPDSALPGVNQQRLHQSSDTFLKKPL